MVYGRHNRLGREGVVLGGQKQSRAEQSRSDLIRAEQRPFSQTQRKAEGICYECYLARARATARARIRVYWKAGYL
jgi:hypothetical protein